MGPVPNGLSAGVIRTRRKNRRTGTVGPRFAEQARQELKEGVDAVANAVKTTLGPKGRNVAIDKKFGSPTVTHDGVTIANEIDIMNREEFLAIGGTDLGSQTDWLDEVTETPISHTHGLSVSGSHPGTGRNRYPPPPLFRHQSRCRQYKEAGADALFVEAANSENELETIAKELPSPSRLEGVS